MDQTQAMLQEFASRVAAIEAASGISDIVRLGLSQLLLVSKQSEAALNYQTSSSRVRLNTQLKRNMESGANFAVNLSARDVVSATAAATTGEVSKSISAIGKVYNQAIDQKWRRIVDINQRVANQAITDMLEKYDEIHRARSKGSPYRIQERYTGGKLRAALASPTMAQVTLDGVTFINTDLLDVAAKQWARLNFGAGARAGSGSGSSASHGSLDIKRFGVSASFFQSELGLIPAFDVRMPYGPRPAFFIPQGIWSRGSDIGSAVKGQVKPGPRRGHSFFPMGQIERGSLSDAGRKKLFANSQKRKFTKGVKAWGFLEVGVASLARNLPAANAGYMQQIFNESDPSVGAQRVRNNIPPERYNAAAEILRKSVAEYRRAGGKF